MNDHIAENLKKGRDKGTGIDNPTDDEKRQLRDELPHVVIVSGNCSKRRRLHIPDQQSEEILPQCAATGGASHLHTDHSEWMTREFEHYPFGYQKWCKNCVQTWRDNQDREDNSGFECGECDRGAIGLVKVHGSTLYLCRVHYRDAIEEWAEVMDTHRLLPAGDGDD